MVCSHGDRRQTFVAFVWMPESCRPGSTFKVRIDSTSSQKISHLGLRYIHDMTTDYVLPDGVSYVEGSARIIPDTGTPNVYPGATVTCLGRTIRMSLPAHVENGSSYTPPSIEFALHIDAPAGTDLALMFSHYETYARVFLIGEVKTTCDPSPQPYVIGMTHVVR